MDAFLKTDPVPCVIDGKPHLTGQTYDVSASSNLQSLIVDDGVAIQVVDPHKPSRVVHKVASASKADVLAAVESAAVALPAWRRTSAMQRREIFVKAAQIIKDRAEQFAAIETAETTSGHGWAMFGTSLTVDAVTELAGVVSVALRSEVATTEHGKTAFIDRVPYGVVLGIARERPRR